MSYDTWGNVSIGGPGGGNLRTFDVQNHDTAYGYDGAGNLTNDGTFTYSYDAEEQISSVTSNSTGVQVANYVYDADGNRVRKNVGSGWTEYISFGSNIVAENSPSGWTDYIFAGDKRIAQVSSSGTQYYWGDHLGTTKMTLDASGNSQCYATYTPFGSEVSGCPTHYKFTGKERDNESTLDHFKYRNYASSMGRWMSPDPSQLAFSSLGNPQSLNLYSYVGNNPINRVDLDGLCWRGFQWACNVGQRFDNLVHGEGFHTNKGVEDIAHKHNAQRRQQEVNGTSRAYSLGVRLGRWARTREEFYRKMMCYPFCDVQVFGGTGWGEIDQFLKPRPPLRVVHNEPPLQTSASYQEWNKKSTQEIIDSLAPGNPQTELTVYPDGSIANGNTRITILQERGVDVNALPQVDRIPEPVIDPVEPEIPE